jgi:hypothetical protein
MGHYPPEKIAFAMRTPTWCRTRGDQIGPHAVAVIADLLAVNALSGCAPRKACSAWRASTARPGWRPPAARQSRSATPRIAPSKASSPPPPKPTRH